MHGCLPFKIRPA
uniref:Uncharacterized protein n=1 Tax=Arundo donax TaxID=35708 RepID=A0A0A9EJ32_ARUDO